ncbi:MAG: T9SS type A sorting domain-containing protein [Bacteroidetes bacterium]|nr:T9SS type A sorting domain-containing protein [Bacteroidota bacterium]
MKRIAALFLMVSLAGKMVSAQETFHKQQFDLQNRVTPVCSPQWYQGTTGTCIGLNSLVAEDIDHDGKTEIICAAGSGLASGSGLFWYVMKYDAAHQDYRQTWMSPPMAFNFGMYSISCIRAFDVDNDHIFEIFVGFHGGHIEVYKGTDMHWIGSFFAGEAQVNDILYADANNDGQKEIVSCDNDRSYFFNPGNFTLRNTIPYGSYRFSAGNVDNDPGIEIVYSNGIVLEINANTPTIEWSIYSPAIFGAMVALTDTDNDGMDEVVIAKSWYTIEVFDADLKALKGTIQCSDIDAMIAADVDGDAKKEILYGDGQWGNVHCVNSQTLLEMWQIPEYDGVTQIGVADVDNDSLPEVLWGGGCSSSGTDYLYIYNITDQALEFTSGELCGPFYDVETGDVDGDGEDEIVTVSSQSGSDYDSGILSVFDGVDGVLEWQSDINFFQWNHNGIHCLELADLTGDSIKEIIVGADKVYQGAVYIVSGVTHHVISSKIFTSGGVDSFLGLDVADADNDGTSELVMCDYDHLFVVNPVTFSVEWASPLLPGNGVQSVKTGNVDGDQNPEMIVCSGYITVFDGITHEQWTSTESNCTNICLYDWDSDGVSEIIACTDNGKILMMDRQSNLTTLLLQAGNGLLEGVRVINPGSGGLPEFVFTSGGKIFIANTSGDIVSTEGFGPEAGSYDALKLSDINHDGHLEIFAGSQYQVVQVSEECSRCFGFSAIAGSLNASCIPGNDGTMTATPVAGEAPFTYQWSNGSTGQSVSGLAPGDYLVRLSDNMGCQAKDTATVSQSTISAAISGKSVGCYGLQDGIARIAPEGTPPYQYLWNNGGTEQIITGLASGTYSCLVTDDMRCSMAKNINIKQDTVQVTLVIEEPECFGEGGTVRVHVVSGIPPFTYLWEGISGDSVAYHVPAGTNILTVRDTLNCKASRQITITTPPELMISTSYVPDNPDTPELDGEATVFALGGTPPYHYHWNDSLHQNKPTAVSLGNGKYLVIVSDFAGCYQLTEIDLYGLSVNGIGIIPPLFKVFPNPAADILHVAVDFPCTSSGSIKLINATGKVKDTKPFNCKGQANFTFDLEGLPPSIYILVLQTGHITLSRRIIIDR